MVGRARYPVSLPNLTILRNPGALAIVPLVVLTAYNLIVLRRVCPRGPARQAGERRWSVHEDRGSPWRGPAFALVWTSIAGLVAGVGLAVLSSYLGIVYGRFEELYYFRQRLILRAGTIFGPAGLAKVAMGFQSGSDYATSTSLATIAGAIGKCSAMVV